jgi:hypothetical protein
MPRPRRQQKKQAGTRRRQAPHVGRAGHDYESRSANDRGSPSEPSSRTADGTHTFRSEKKAESSERSPVLTSRWRQLGLGRATRESPYAIATSGARRLSTVASSRDVAPASPRHRGEPERTAAAPRRKLGRKVAARDASAPCPHSLHRNVGISTVVRGGRS